MNNYEENNNYLTKEEIKTLLITASKVDDLIYNFTLISLSTGMRRGETLGLSWDNIDIDKKLIYVVQKLTYSPGQGLQLKKIPVKYQRKLYIDSKEVLNALKKIYIEQKQLKYLLKDKYNNKNNLVFCDDHGKSYHPSAVTKKFNDIIIIAALNKNISIHSLRKTYANLLFQEDINLQTIKDKLGISILNESYITE